MFNVSETGPEIQGNQVRFRIYLPSIEKNHGFTVKVYVINIRDQFDANVPADVYDLNQKPQNPPDDNLWGKIAKTRWQSDLIMLSPGTYLYRFEITGPAHNGGKQVRSLYFGDPCARETDVGVFSVLHIPAAAPYAWNDRNFKVTSMDEIILYELNVAEFGRDFKGVADRIPYLLSLGINAIELMPINSIAEPNRWGYVPIFYFAPEERFGGPQGLRDLVQKCHAANIAVVLDMVYAHTERMFPYQIGYERFFHLWEDDHYIDGGGIYHAPNPLVCVYDNFGKKNDWRMASTREFFAGVNAFWLEEYHIDGFRYDHVNGYLDRKPITRDGKIDWYSHENRPNFTSLKELTQKTYAESKKYSRFIPAAGGASQIIQIAEDLGESAYQLSPVSASAVNGNWEKRLGDIAKKMVTYNFFSPEFVKELLLTDERFDKQGYTGLKNIQDETIPALVVQFIESHDENRLFYLMQHREDCEDGGYEYRNGLDDQPWWKLQPYAIGLLTSVGIPMLWAGQEFAENTGLAATGLVRVRGLRPLHWDYFYNVSTTPGGATVLPLVTLYRNLGKLRKNHPALRAPRENAKEEYCNKNDRVLVYRRWKDNEVIIVAINFSETWQHVPIPFGHSGTWVDVLDAEYNNSPYEKNIADSSAHEWTSIPSNFGRVLRLM
jgi:maltooligosyltrehalose trehalohydrolase